MDFDQLYERILPRLKAMVHYTARKNYNLAFDEEDLFQEGAIYLWDNFKNGVPEGLNNSYIVKGCQFHLLNYMRKKRNEAYFLSIDKPIDEDGNTLKEVLADKREPLHKVIDRKIAVDYIHNNGFSD
ncbi:MAG: hypothetical protein ABIH08_05345, partial [Candidatus Omnitrophota bacterium]